MIGLGHSLALALAASKVGGDGVVCDVYVDAVGGSDSYSGRSAALAKRTLAGAVAIAGSSEVIGLKRGSFWREEMDLSGLTAPSVVAYGNGAPPHITGADIITEWTNVGGSYPSVYETEVTHAGGGRLRVFARTNGVLEQLTGVADLPACEATPGTFVRPTYDSPATIYIHPLDGLDPTSSPVQYEVPVRRTCITGQDGCSVSGVETGEALSNNGSVDFVARNGCLVERVIGANGTKHSVGSGDGDIRDSVAFGVDATVAEEPSNAAFVAFLDNPAGKTAAFRRCGVIAHGVGINNDYIAHGNPNPFDFVTVEQGWMVLTGGFAGSSVDLNRGSYYDGIGGYPGGYGTSKMLMVKLPAGTSKGPTLGNYGDEKLEDCVIYRPQVDADNYDAAFRLNGTHAVEISHCAMYCQTSFVSGNASSWFGAAEPSNVLNLHHSIFFNGSNFMLLYNGQSYQGDYNVFIAGEPGETRPVLFNSYLRYALTLGEWQADSGQDLHSVWLARADQVRGNSNAFWLGVSLDLNDGPLDGDWRINPNARVYSGADTAYIGTFPDGTPITQAGPQNHWAWDTRASVAGPPVRWPIVPASLSEARTYVNNPEGWNFYP